jgi:hypothetical protein
LKKFIVSLFTVLLCASSVVAQDSLVVAPVTDSMQVTIEQSVDSAAVIEQTTIMPWRPKPGKAMLMSALIPGGGQAYNRKYWKIPIVCAGYAALIYAISWNGKYYNDYKRAYISIADNDPATNDYQEYIPAGQVVDDSYMYWLTDALNKKQLSYRQNRDLSIICIVGFYGLTILDAFVDAQLYDFDINPDLSLRVEPILTNDLLNSRTSFGLNCKLTF